MHLFDTHTHLQDGRIFAAAADLLIRASHAGIAQLLCCGTQETDWERVVGLAKEHRMVIPALGLHPWYISQRSPQWLTTLEQQLCLHPNMAVGEIGLDFSLSVYNKEDQLAVFRQQLLLARALGRPASIHCRNAWGALMELLRRERGIAANGIIHSYSGPVELISELEQHGLYLSISGSVTHVSHVRVRAAACAISSSRLLIETDSPDISPAGHSGCNEPATLRGTVALLAELRNTTEAAVGNTTYENAGKLFFR